MTKAVFKLDKTLRVGNFNILCDPEVLNQGDFTFKPGIKIDSKLKNFIKKIFWPLYSLRNYLLIDGFIERDIGKLIKKYLKDDFIFLDVGCGNMRFRRFLPPSLYYNAFDIVLSEFNLKKTLAEREKVNLALFSATKIPLDSETISMAISSQVISQIKDVDKVISEVYRVLKPEGIFILSVPNGYCYKFKKKGPHPACTDNWTFNEFKEYMAKYGFICLEGYMKGYWLPFPRWFTNTSYQLPISLKQELYNTDFLFVFQK